MNSKGKDSKLKSYKEIVLDAYLKDLKVLLSKKGSSVFWMALGGMFIAIFGMFIAQVMVRFVETVFGQTALFLSILIAFIFLIIGYGMMRKGWEDWKK